MTKKVLSLLLVAIITLSCVAVASNAVWSHEAPKQLTVTDTMVSLYIKPTEDNSGVRYKFTLVPEKSWGDVDVDFLKACEWKGNYDEASGSNIILTTDCNGTALTSGAKYRAFSQANFVSGDPAEYSTSKYITVSMLGAAPKVPTSEEIYLCAGEETDTTLTFYVQPHNVQYCYNGKDWIDVSTSNSKIVVGGLSAATDYTFLFRIKASSDQYQGDDFLTISAHTVSTPDTEWGKPSAPKAVKDKTGTDFRTEKVIYVEYQEFKGHAADECKVGVPAHKGNYIYYVNDKVAHCREVTSVEYGSIIEIDGYYIDATARANNVVTPLEVNKVYSVTRTVGLTAFHKESPKSDAVTIRTKDIPKPPKKPVPIEVTDTTIRMEWEEGDIEYSYEPDNPDSWISSSINGDGSHKFALFTGLEPNQTYTIVSRYKETNNSIMSGLSETVDVPTKSSAKDAPADIILLDKRMTGKDSARIVVQQMPGVIFRICEMTSGTEVWSKWDESGEFTVINPESGGTPVKLVGGKTYVIQAMKRYDRETEMESKTTSKVVTIPTRTPFYVEFSKLRISYSNTAQTYGKNYIRGTDTVKFTAVGDIFSTRNDTVFIYGDERYYPVYYYTNVNGTHVPINDGDRFDMVSASFKITCTTSMNRVYVGYEEQKFDGEKWVTLKDTNGNPKVIEHYCEISVKPDRTIITNITDFFTFIGNFLLDKLPTFIMKMFSLFG